MARTTTTSAPPAAQKPPSSAQVPESTTFKQPLTATLGRFSALFLWAAFMIIFGIANSEVFLSGTTLRLTFAQGVVTAVVGLAFLVPLAAGVYDLSVGAQMGLSLVILSWFALHHPDVPIWLVAILAVATCSLVGLLSGLIVVKFKVNSLIATLGVSQVLTAATLKISDNQQIAGAFSPSFSKLGNRNVGGIPLVLIYLLVIAAIVWYVLEQTPVGRYLLATGANPEAARLAGLPVNALTYGSLVASGGLAGIAGVIFAMQVGVYSDNAGPSQLFPALAAVFFGASQFSRRPNVWGTVVAYFALAFGVKGLQIAFGPGTFWIQPLFQGVALLVAVALASRVVGQTRRSRKAQQTPPSGGVIDIDEPPAQDVPPAPRVGP
jgi:ribose transport system permease protein